jgi:hypothetical protein
METHIKFASFDPSLEKISSSFRETFQYPVEHKNDKKDKYFLSLKNNFFNEINSFYFNIKILLNAQFMNFLLKFLNEMMILCKRNFYMMMFVFTFHDLKRFFLLQTKITAKILNCLLRINFDQK